MTMWITVDTSVCCGHGRCAAAAPDIYRLDDNGYCGIESLELLSGQEDAARAGAASCPERAIRIADRRLGPDPAAAS